jgi:hypothetical protein
MATAWIAAPYHGEPISGEYQIVYARSLASEMSNGNAQQLMREAQIAHKDYIWDMVPSGNFFIVEGTKK